MNQNREGVRSHVPLLYFICLDSILLLHTQYNLPAELSDLVVQAMAVAFAAFPPFAVASPLFCAVRFWLSVTAEGQTGLQT